jgi:hypothetical protein
MMTLMVGMLMAQIQTNPAKAVAMQVSPAKEKTYERYDADGWTWTDEDGGYYWRWRYTPAPTIPHHEPRRRGEQHPHLMPGALTPTPHSLAPPAFYSRPAFAPTFAPAGCRT